MVCYAELHWTSLTFALILFLQESVLFTITSKIKLKPLFLKLELDCSLNKHSSAPVFNSLLLIDHPSTTYSITKRNNIFLSQLTDYFLQTSSPKVLVKSIFLFFLIYIWFIYSGKTTYKNPSGHHCFISPFPCSALFNNAVHIIESQSPWLRIFFLSNSYGLHYSRHRWLKLLLILHNLWNRFSLCQAKGLVQ